MLKSTITFHCEKCGAPATDTVESHLSFFFEGLTSSELNMEPEMVEWRMARFMWQMVAGEFQILCRGCLAAAGEDQGERKALTELTVLQGNKQGKSRINGDQAVKMRWYRCSYCRAYLHVPDDDKKQICPFCENGVLVFDKYTWVNHKEYEDIKRVDDAAKRRNQIQIVRKTDEGVDN